MRYLAIFFAISLSVFLSSCEEEMEVWDFASIEFTVCVQNADGDNLLDKDVPDNIITERTWKWRCGTGQDTIPHIGTA